MKNLILFILLLITVESFSQFCDIPPIFNNTNRVIDVDTVYLNGAVQSVYTYDTIYLDTTITVNELIPDNTGEPFESIINVDFLSAYHLLKGPAFQLSIDLEHTYSADLEVFLTAPNDSVIYILEHPNQLGEYDFNGGYLFDFVLGTDIINNANIVYESYIDNYEYYMFASSATPLIGSTLNGDWKLSIIDHASQDQGQLNSWSLKLLYFPEYPEDSMLWSGDDIVWQDGLNAKAVPEESGLHSYTFSVTNDINCTYDTTINVEISNSIIEGTVLLNQQVYTQGQVFLYPYNNSYNSASEVCREIPIQISNINSLGQYSFTDLALGDYLVQFMPNDLSVMSTYYPNSSTWSNAQIITVESNIESNIDILINQPINAQGTSSVLGGLYKAQSIGESNSDVFLFNQNHEPVFYTKTDSTGAYSFINIPEGEYYICPDIPCLELDSVRSISVSVGTSLTSMDFMVDNRRVYVIPASSSSLAENLNVCMTNNINLASPPHGYDGDFFSGGHADAITDFYVDEYGNIYLVGAKYYGLITASNKMFIKKMDSHGNEIWVKEIDYYSNNDSPGSALTGITGDEHGNIYVTGSVKLTDNIVMNTEMITFAGAQVPFCPDETKSSFIMKLSSEGERLWDIYSDLQGCADIVYDNGMIYADFLGGSNTETKYIYFPNGDIHTINTNTKENIHIIKVDTAGLLLDVKATCSLYNSDLFVPIILFSYNQGGAINAANGNGYLTPRLSVDNDKLYLFGLFADSLQIESEVFREEGDSIIYNMFYGSFNLPDLSFNDAQYLFHDEYLKSAYSEIYFKPDDNTIPVYVIHDNYIYIADNLNLESGVCKYDLSGNLIWKNKIHSNYNLIKDIKVVEDDVFVSGFFMDSIIIEDQSGYYEVFRSENTFTDLFFLSYTEEGNINWTGNFGSDGFDHIFGSTVSQCNELNLLGTSLNTIQIGDLYHFNNSSHVFLAKLTTQDCNNPDCSPIVILNSEDSTLSCNDTILIEWQNVTDDNINLSYSIDGLNYISIAENIPDSITEYEWVVPDELCNAFKSGNLLVRIQSNSNPDIYSFKEYIIDNSTSLIEVSKKGISLYPNPVKQYLNIESQCGELSIYNYMGQMVFNGYTEGFNVVPVHKLSKGTYVVVVTNEDSFQLKKFVVN